ncbi:class I SAM-dependent methyltransferase [Parablautia muri]|uniref:Class I SAM-dependent methyltransferase n=1 Tax=Parablautia muri TaxID=2320879 RepID=A0A9X5GQL7_9FIRM|nr:class I SAM-dependent methyltransferase [Parablautia muri]NBJ91344.1 class I SAM-dependent methyltransferase [Parablautia muri]
MSDFLQKLYSNRFSNKEIEKKNRLWKCVCSYFEKFLPSVDVAERGVMVDVAAGYCDFINNIQCDWHKVAIDVNPDVQVHAGKEVRVIVDDIKSLPKYFERESVDIFFMSNFLEHISKSDISMLFKMEKELLKPNGEIWILTPNIKYVKGQYWDFFDHITPITEKALIEEACTHGFRVKKCIKKFLPFTTKSKLPQAGWIVKLYLRLMPLSGFFWGKQSFLIFKKRISEGEKKIEN